MSHYEKQFDEYVKTGERALENDMHTKVMEALQVEEELRGYIGVDTSEKGEGDWGYGVSWLHTPTKPEQNSPVSLPNKYLRQTREGVNLDVYDVLDAFKVENPAVQHALKKMLCTGSRGYKDYQQDIQEAIDSLERAKSFPPIPF